MRLSYVILGRNQCDAMMRTISLLPSITPLPAGQWEVWAVDNGGFDQSAEKISAKFGRVNVMRCESDRDRAAINQAVTCCTGEYVICLNADTHPLDPRAVRMTLEHMQHRPSAAAVVGKLVLSDESTFAGDFPTVITPGATCFRRSALQKIGGFDEQLSGVCADYDLSFRIWQNNMRVERREDIVFGRDAKAEDTNIEKAELRDHVILVSRYLPREFRGQYTSDWKLRCCALAMREDGFFKTQKQILQTRMWQLTNLFRKQTPLGDAAIEQIFGFRHHAQAIGQWARQHTVWRVVLADFGKNIWAAYNACRASGLQIRCVADNQQAFAKMKYRGLPIVPINKAFEGAGIDGVVVCGLNPSQIDQRMKSLRHHFKGPILRLWQPPRQAMQSSVAEAA